MDLVRNKISQQFIYYYYYYEEGTKITNSLKKILISLPLCHAYCTIMEPKYRFHSTAMIGDVSPIQDLSRRTLYRLSSNKPIFNPACCVLPSTNRSHQKTRATVTEGALWSKAVMFPITVYVLTALPYNNDLLPI